MLIFLGKNLILVKNAEFFQGKNLILVKNADFSREKSEFGQKC